MGILLDIAIKCHNTYNVFILVAPLRGGKSVSFPFKSLSLLFVLIQKKPKIKITHCNHHNSIIGKHKPSTHRSVNFVNEAMPDGIGPFRPLA